MPTLPHEHRGMAESFGADAARYDRARSPYPAELIDRIAATAPGPDVLDVGCGTGIEARQLRAAGCRVRGVEPDERMAAFARRDGFEVDVSTFETWEPAGRMFDAVVAGQSWHWVDPVAGAAKAAAVLRPGGRLTPFAHTFVAPSEVNRAFAETYQRLVPDSPVKLGNANASVEAYAEFFANAVSKGMREAGFGEPERWTFPWEHVYTRDEYLDQIPTNGLMTRLPPADLAEILDAVGTAIDGLGGSFTMPYLTTAVSAARQ